MARSNAKPLAGILVCAGLLNLSACGDISNDFAIQDPENTIASAEIRLCHRHVQMIKSGKEFRGTMPITCEGEGRILVRFVTGHQSICKIGYVTPGAQQGFQFVVAGGKCGPSTGHK